MQWKQVAANWTAFIEPINQRWPETDEARLEDIDGDRRELIVHIAEATEQSVAEAQEELNLWLESGVPLDVLMDESNDNEQIVASGNFIPAGEDVYADDAAFGDDDIPDRPIGRS